MRELLTLDVSSSEWLRLRPAHAARGVGGSALEVPSRCCEGEVLHCAWFGSPIRLAAAARHQARG